MIPAIPDLEMLAAGPFTMEQLVVVLAPTIAPRAARARGTIPGRPLGGPHRRGRRAAALQRPHNAASFIRLQPCRRQRTRATLTLRSLAPTDYRSFLISCYRDRPWFDAHAAKLDHPRPRQFRAAYGQGACFRLESAPTASPRIPAGRTFSAASSPRSNPPPATPRASWRTSTPNLPRNSAHAHRTPRHAAHPRPRARHPPGPA